MFALTTPNLHSLRDSLDSIDSLDSLAISSTSFSLTTFSFIATLTIL